MTPEMPKPQAGASMLGRESTLAGRAILVLSPTVRGEIKGPNGTVRTVFADSLAHLLELARQETRPVILLQGGSLDETEIEIASGLHLLPYQPSVAVLAIREQLDQSLTMARRLGIGCLFTHDCLNYPAELDGLVKWLDARAAPLGLERYLADGTEIWESAIRGRNDKAEIIESVVDGAAQVNEDRAFQFDLRLIMEELLNNAIYHAFQDNIGREKYRIGNFKGLAEGESIRVRTGHDDRTFAVSISDNQGTLRRDTVLHKLERHVSVRGLLDENGRGLYLTYSLAGRVVFNLRKGELTELIVLFPTHADAWPERSALKPVLVFET